MSAEVISISDYRFVNRRRPRQVSVCAVVPLFRSAEPASMLLLADASNDEDRLAGRGRDAG